MKDDTNPIRVALPLGVGDCFWSCQKLHGLSKLFGHAPIHVFVNERQETKATEFLRLVPCVEKVEGSRSAPRRIRVQLTPDYRDGRWSTLEGSAGWNGFDYVFCANGHIEQGKPIREFMPELETEYDFDYLIDVRDEEDAVRLMPDPEVLLYPSAMGPNVGFHGLWWGVRDWVSVIRLFNSNGIRPILVGGNCVGDMYYASVLSAYRPDIDFKSVVGLTSAGTIVAMLRRCKLWMGLSSGYGIVAAAMETPTVMFWSDNRWKMGEVSFRTEMQTAWLREAGRDHYRTFHFGSPEMNPQAVVNKAMEIMR